MYKNKSVSIVLPVYNEVDNIKFAIEEFFLQPEVDEVIVVDNNSSDGSMEEIVKTRAKYFLETTQGYGAAMRRGMSEATGQVIITAEPDGTFSASDIEKFLVYADEFDVVFGTRTSRSLIWSKANMDTSLRLGNAGVAKLLEYMFNGPSLTDVGCTYKLIHRSAYEQIKAHFTVNGNWFSPEFMIRALQSNFRCVEVPVNYRARIGQSKITGRKWPAIKLGLRMIFFIISEKLKMSVRN
ncbi:MAG TPA: glycosyltransferase family 2 protein [Candidatus Paceibacterota bacterium]